MTVVGVRSRALFLDRDGVINVDRGYVHRVEQFEFMPGIFELARAAHQDGWRLIVITNQAGIGRGYYTEGDFWTLSRWMCARFAAEQAPIVEVYQCPTHPEAPMGRYRVADDRDRKPGPGMILRAARDHALDLTRSALIGDKGSDIAAGLAAGIGRNLLLRGNLRDRGTVDPRAIEVDSLLAAQGLLCASQAGLA